MRENRLQQLDQQNGNVRDSSFIHKRDSSLQDFLSANAQNVSFTNMHQTSFEIEDPLPIQHSPLQQRSNYIPSSFLSKPFDENIYDMNSSARGMSSQQQQQSRYSWQNNYSIQNTSYPQSVPLANSLNSDGFGSIHYGNNQLWDNTNHGSHDPTSLFDYDLQQNSLVSHNYTPGMYGETAMNDYFFERNKSRRHSNNTLRPINSQQVYGNFIDTMMEDEEGGNLHQRRGSNMLEENDLLDNPFTTAKSPINNIVVQYDNYQDKIKKEAEPENNISSPSLLNSALNYPGSKKLLKEKIVQGLNNNLDFDCFKENQKNLIDKPSESCLNSKQIQENVDPEEKQNLFKQENSELVCEQSQQDQNSSAATATPAATVASASNTTSGDSNNPTQNRILSSYPCVCNCKKTKCLKLYCECFAKLGFCGEGCHCHECKNRPDNEDERNLAIQEAKQRNPDAFVPKVSTEAEIQAELKRKSMMENQKKGCNCRKTKCLKKYCECFNGGSFCNDNCKCENCENFEGNPYFLMQKRGGGGTSDFSSLFLNSNLITSSHEIDQSSNIFMQNRFDYQMPISSHSGIVGMSKLGLSGMQKFPLTMQSYRDSIGPHSGHTHSSILGFVKQDVNCLDGEGKPSNYLKQQASYQSKRALERENEDSDHMSSSTNSMASASSLQRNGKFKSHKNKGLLASSKKYFKKPIIKPHADNSDEDFNSSSQQQVYTNRPGTTEVRLASTRRIKNRSEAALAKDDEDLFLQQHLDDMEKKLKQIQQVQNILNYQQQLKEQAKILSENSNNLNPSVTPNISQGETSTQAAETWSGESVQNGQSSQINSLLLEQKNQELQRQKQELEQQLKSEMLEEKQQQSSQYGSHSPQAEQIFPNQEVIQEYGIEEEEQGETSSIDQQSISQNADIISSDLKKQKRKSKIANTQLSGEKQESIEIDQIALDAGSMISDNTYPSLMQEESSSSSSSGARANQDQQFTRLNPSHSSRFSRTRCSRLSQISSEDSPGLKVMGSSTLFSLSSIAPTAKPSDLLFDPTNYSNSIHN